ncbi:GntR family transcriptional regulator [Sneathiella chinensis]|uniref:GntR family transcriptional regulator n=1 Tax=Sneathiella chinensis TaxID=349750 RepID=A0ABQ5U4I8_9PROT|nr:GntR family transcriptional regulator [Sneathiella chinensis]GLQ05396.1 GntR family transcriptional regulator [Sneathiella chinensis]
MSTSVQRLRAKSYSAEIVSVIEDMIATNQLRGGDRLREQDLSNRLGVSRTPLREAFKTLAERGLIRIRPNFGAEVVLPSKEEVTEMVHTMCWIWEKLGQLACRNISFEEMAELQVLHKEMQDRVGPDDALEWSLANTEFHRILMEASHNKTLLEIATNLQRRVHISLAGKNLSPDHRVEANEEHQEILDAIAHEEPDTLSRLLHDHLERAWQRRKALT